MRAGAASSVWVRLRLFVGSYVPLWVIIALRQESSASMWFFVALAVSGAVSTLLILVDVHRLEPGPYRVADVADRGSEVAGYLATYLLPFVMATSPSARDLAAYALFLAVMACVYVQSNMVAINPLLYLARRRVHTVTTGDGVQAYLISRTTPRSGDIVLAAELGDGVLIETRAAA
jgi:hypothetical protein